MLQVACGFVTSNRCKHAARFYRKLTVAALWICWLKWLLLAIVITDKFFQDLHARFLKLCCSSVLGQSFTSIKRNLRTGHEAIACGGDLYRRHYHHHRHHHYPNHHHYYYDHYYYKYYCWYYYYLYYSWTAIKRPPSGDWVLASGRSIDDSHKLA